MHSLSNNPQEISPFPLVWCTINPTERNNSDFHLFTQMVRYHLCKLGIENSSCIRIKPAKAARTPDQEAVHQPAPACALAS